MRTEVALPSAKAFMTRALKAEPLYVWYDYFSCPQLEHISSHGDVAPVDSGGMSNLAKAGNTMDVMMWRYGQGIPVMPGPAGAEVSKKEQ